MPLFKHALLAAAALALLSACGGGGDPAPADPTTPTFACLALPQEVTLHPDDRHASEWKDVAVDARNRLWLAGYERGRFDGGNLEPAGDARAVVRQLAADGQTLFDSGARLDSAGADVAEALAVDDDGRITVAGRTTGVLAGARNAGQFDAFVARLDSASPAEAWALGQAGDEAPQRPRRVATLGRDTVFVAGLDDVYVPTNFVERWQDTLAMRFNAAGTAAPAAAWQHRSGSTEPDMGSALAVQGGHVFVGGAVLAGAQRGMFVRKLTADGTVLWTARYTSSPLDHVAALVALPDGSLLMAGTVSAPFRGGVYQGQQDVVVARLRADDGALLWSAQFGSAGSDWVSDAKVDAQGRIWLFGETDGSFVAGRAPNGSNDLFLLQLAADGTLQRRWQWGGEADERAGSVAVDRCGRAVAVGSTTDTTQRRALLWFPPVQ